MKTISRAAVLFFVLFFFTGISFSQNAVTQTKDSQSKMDPDKALNMLKDGNQRYVSGTELKRDLLDQVKSTSKGQYPYAVILSCMDSRVPPELVFDQGIGDVFVIRVAGNVISDDAIGSMEYACKVVGVKLVVVLGHTSCGAVKGACDNAQLGELTQLLNKIKPALDKSDFKGDRTSKNEYFVDGIAEINVADQVDLIKKPGTIVGDMIANGDVGIVGAMYDVSTGKVDFYSK